MQPNSNRRVRALAVALSAAALLTGTSVQAKTAAHARVHAYAGLQVLFVTGVHRDVAGSQYGVGGAALLEFGARMGRVGIVLEGIPPVSIPQRASAYYGQATPAVGIFNGAVRFAVDRNRRLWIGAGTTVINQRTPLPNISQVASSRLAGARYELAYEQPLRAARFVEVLVGAAPRLFGADRFLYSNGSPAVNKDERASEVDATLAYGIRYRESELLVGIRTIDFSAQFTRTGEAADRNNGAGLMLEWRRLIGS
ncbi:MAG: hypothetical protein ACYDEK_05070 [Vulcanimicrobiaceae bacterium]